ncbi:uncharacterized protein LOC141590483 [Silene latifolia]|uniref:uncharacterized protein LOC141590483 n=1 Tax=Silene latifolia TaxID=37657 RepID=UPI003D78841A
MIENDINETTSPTSYNNINNMNRATSLYTRVNENVARKRGKMILSANQSSRCQTDDCDINASTTPISCITTIRGELPANKESEQCAHIANLQRQKRIAIVSDLTPTSVNNSSLTLNIRSQNALQSYNNIDTNEENTRQNGLSASGQERKTIKRKSFSHQRTSVLQSLARNINDTVQDVEDVETEAVEVHHPDYWDIGDPTYECGYCEAQMWYEERARKDRSSSDPEFSICCMKGKVQLPKLRDPPPLLWELLSNKHPLSKHFIDNIRSYNMMFSFTSMGGRIDTSVNQGQGPYCFKMGGQNVHLIGSLLPSETARPKFCQLYIFDTEEEINNRKNVVSFGRPEQFSDELIALLQGMIDQHNRLAKTFRMARDRFQSAECGEVKLRLIGGRKTDGRTYNLPTASGIAALIVGDITDAIDQRDIILETQNGTLKRISELHPSYLALQYPLLFPFGEDGFRLGIDHRLTNKASTSKTTSKRNKLTMRELFAYRIQDRSGERTTFLIAGKVYQQFLVDGYMMVESQQLSYIRNNQQSLRSESYKNLADAVGRGAIDPSSIGCRIIIPPSFTPGYSYLRENYQDTMVICKWTGYPDLFITFTCNPKWPEITRFVKKRGLRPEDRPDILCRVFSIKLNELIKDLKERHIFGRPRGVVYTIEFQKRGLPHAHIILFLNSGDKLLEVDDIDNIISAEIPDPAENPELHEAVTEYMMHGPCGKHFPRSPCMDRGQCTKHFPRQFNQRTTIDEDGYPVYRRRKNGITVVKKGEKLHNGFVVPYNPKLLLKYRAHINVEWCNQSRSIKYLFKYINKGYDRVTLQSSHMRQNADDPEKIDEIKRFYDCRYISACEASWRIFAFDTHYRTPPVQRLSFHLPNEQSVVFNDDDPIDSVIQRPLIEKTMFLA